MSEDKSENAIENTQKDASVLQTLRKAMNTQYHIYDQREQYGREVDSNREKKLLCAQVLHTMGFLVSPMPPSPYISRGEGCNSNNFWQTHNPDDWEMWNDIPKEFEGCEWRRISGTWHPFIRNIYDELEPFER